MRSILIGLIVAASISPAHAQRKKEILAFNLEPYATSPRSFGPILVKVGLESRVQYLLDGTLHLKFFDGSSKLLEVRVPDIVVTESGYETILTLPPLPESMSKGLNIDARFITEDKEIVLSSSDATTDELTLLISPNDMRGMLIGMVVADKSTEKSPPRQFAAKRFKFDTYAWQPDQFAEETAGRQLRYGHFATTVSTLEPSDLPEDPLAFCAFNVVCILEEGFGLLSQKQLDAMKTWIRGGGRVCIIPDGLLRRRHTGFLTEVLAEMKDPPPMGLDGTSGLICDGSLRAMAKFGLGRVVVLSPKIQLETTLDEDECKELTSFLWDVRRLQRGRESWRIVRDQSEGDYWGYRPPTALANKNDFEQTTTQLMPSNVKMVPLSLVGLLLGVYVFIVGPGDYLLLGLLKARRFTWIVFPLVTAGFTFALVALSNHYMSTTESGGRIEINDVVGSGMVARQSTIRLDFAPEAQEVEDEARAQLHSPIDIRQASSANFGGFQPYGQPSASRVRRTNTGRTSSWLKGRFPARYTLHRTLKQWEPQLTRSMSFEADEAPDLGFDWDNPGAIWDQNARFKLGRKISAAKKSAVGVWLQNATNTFKVLELPPADWHKIGEEYRMNFGGYELITSEHNEYSHLIRRASAQQNNFFSYVSTVSPHGAGNFEDLALLDVSNADQWLLCVTWLEDAKQIVYRRLYNRSELERKAQTK